jgi:HTH-type transcriptional regulator/antitoxin HigA
LPEIENRANGEASNYLIERERFESFIKRHGRVCYESDICRFAQDVKIHPGIIVGQLHGRKALDFKFHRKMLVKVRQEIVGQAITDGWGNVPRV